MKRLLCFGFFLSLCSVGSSPALAHPGDHSGFTLVTLIGHLLEPDHLVFVALIVLVGILAFRAGRRAGVRGQGRRKP